MMRTSRLSLPELSRTRVELGYRNRTDFANSPQFTVRTLSDIENGPQQDA